MKKIHTHTVAALAAAAAADTTCTLWICRQDGHFVRAIEKKAEKRNETTKEITTKKKLSSSKATE